MKCLGICLLFIFVQLSHQIVKKLPDNARPYHYEIKIFPPTKPGMFVFQGESEISLEILKPTVNLTLHSFNLIISRENTKLTTNAVDFKPRNHFFEQESQFLILNFDNEIQPGNYILYLKYTGIVEEEFNSSKSGFFRKKYMNRTIVSTNFKSPHARETFPCWDEPALKATFAIWIKRLPEQAALSNIPMYGIVDETEKNGHMWSVFKKTPPLSTNMVCIIVTDFRHDVSNGPQTFTVISRQEIVNKGFYTLERGTNAISLFEKYIGIEYDLPRMQLLAILEQNQQPMGTCGLIIARELNVPTADYLRDNREVVPYMQMIYELARQWFGCLITPAAPSDTWITEGLALYMSHFILGKMGNFSNLMEYIRNRAPIEALEVDVNLYQPPTVQSGSLKNYNTKAEAIMYMISGTLTEKVFHAAIKKMLQTYKYKTITTDEFWSTVQEAMKESQLTRNNFNLRMYMEPYILRKGYPIINVERDYSCNTIKLTQTSSVKSVDAVEQKWWVPVSIVGSYVLNFSSTFATNWMNPHDEKLITDGLSHDDWWYIVNVQSVGLYRVNYDERNWNRIVDYLNSENFKNIHLLNQMKIVDDALFFGRDVSLSQKIVKGIGNYPYRY